MKRVLPGTTVDDFRRLLEAAPRTYEQMMEAMGVSFRTAKERMRQLRLVANVVEQQLPHPYSVRGNGPKLYRVVREGASPAEIAIAFSATSSSSRVPPPPPKPPAPMPASTRFPFRMLWLRFAAELMLGEAETVDDVDGLVADVADVIGWPPDDLEASIRRVFGRAPANLLHAAR